MDEASRRPQGPRAAAVALSALRSQHRALLLRGAVFILRSKCCRLGAYTQTLITAQSRRLEGQDQGAGRAGPSQGLPPRCADGVLSASSHARPSVCRRPNLLFLQGHRS